MDSFIDNTRVKCYEMKSGKETWKNTVKRWKAMDEGRIEWLFLKVPTQI